MLTKTSFNKPVLLKVLRSVREVLKTKRCALVYNSKGNAFLMLALRKGKFVLISNGKTVNSLIQNKHEFFANYF